MGTNIRELITKKDITIAELKEKILVLDSHNLLYQFLSSIRQADGSLLMDSKSNVTSHLSGLFSRATRFMEMGLKLAFVFDGKPPELKFSEIERRRGLKEEAEKKYLMAEAAEDLDLMLKYAKRTSRLTKEMVGEAKELILALGCPIIQAPSEGEAQAAHMVQRGAAYAVVSEDYDSLLYGAERTIKNLTLTQRRKQKDRLAYESINPGIVSLSDNLHQLEINQDQLIVLAILVGTDFNPGGVKGIGQKKALKLVKQYGKDFETLFGELEIPPEFDWKQVYDVIKHMPVTDNYDLKWNNIDLAKVRRILVETHDFSLERVESTISGLQEERKSKEQQSLSSFFSR